MINNAEHQLTFIEHLRGLADGLLEPRRGGAFVPCGLAAVEDSALSQPGRRSAADAARQRLWRFASGRRRRKPAAGRNPRAESMPDFSKMTQAEKLAWNQARWKRILG